MKTEVSLGNHKFVKATEAAEWIRFKKALKEYLPYYNNERTHMGINYMTPSQLIFESDSKVLTI